MPSVFYSFISYFLGSSSFKCPEPFKEISSSNLSYLYSQTSLRVGIRGSISIIIENTSRISQLNKLRIYRTVMISDTIDLKLFTYSSLFEKQLRHLIRLNIIKTL